MFLEAQPQSECDLPGHVTRPSARQAGRLQQLGTSGASGQRTQTLSRQTAAPSAEFFLAEAERLSDTYQRREGRPLHRGGVAARRWSVPERSGFLCKVSRLFSCPSGCGAMSSGNEVLMVGEVA